MITNLVISDHLSFTSTERGNHLHCWQKLPYPFSVQQENSAGAGLFTGIQSVRNWREPIEDLMDISSQITENLKVCFRITQKWHKALCRIQDCRHFVKEIQLRQVCSQAFNDPEANRGLSKVPECCRNESPRYAVKWFWSERSNSSNWFCFHFLHPNRFPFLLRSERVPLCLVMWISTRTRNAEIDRDWCGRSCRLWNRTFQKRSGRTSIVRRTSSSHTAISADEQRQ
jgi:hypothetical protein